MSVLAMGTEKRSRIQLVFERERKQFHVSISRALLRSALSRYESRQGHCSQVYKAANRACALRLVQVELKVGCIAYVTHRRLPFQHRKFQGMFARACGPNESGDVGCHGSVLCSRMKVLAQMHGSADFKISVKRVLKLHR